MSRNASRVLFYMCVGKKMSTTKTVIESAREALHTRQASHPNRCIAFSMEPYRSFVDSGEFGVVTIWARPAPILQGQVTRVFFFFLLTSHLCHPPMGDHDFCYTSLPLSRWKCIYFDAGFHPVESQRSQCCLVLTTTTTKKCVCVCVCVCVIDRSIDRSRAQVHFQSYSLTENRYRHATTCNRWPLPSTTALYSCLAQPSILLREISPFENSPVNT